MYILTKYLLQSLHFLISLLLNFFNVCFYNSILFRNSQKSGKHVAQFASITNKKQNATNELENGNIADAPRHSHTHTHVRTNAYLSFLLAPKAILRDFQAFSHSFMRSITSR